MDDFLLTMNCGYSSQDVIVGGESCIMDEIFCPDLKSFIQEEPRASHGFSERFSGV